MLSLASDVENTRSDAYLQIHLVFVKGTLFPSIS